MKSLFQKPNNYYDAGTLRQTNFQKNKYLVTYGKPKIKE